MEPPQDFKSLQEGVQKSLVSTVKTVNRIAAEDLSFQRTVNPDVGELLDERASRFRDLSTKLLQSASRVCGAKAPTLEDAEDVEMNWRAVVDVVDSVLEKADTALDEYTGLVKRKEPPTSESASKHKKPKTVGKVIRNANIAKPQVSFEKQPDNFPDGPWKPMLTSKPHAALTLNQSLETFETDNGTHQYKHPYQTEISAMEYPKRVFEVAEPIPYQPVDTTQAVYVDTYDGVIAMLAELKTAKEIAIDLEHHDFRTYVGLVSLMQVSTREKDWIVDTLQPWRHKLEILNEVFADPSIIKVFHGAYMDMVWLQRDLGLYVNGLFDTYFACDLLYSGRSLAFLLSKFVDFDADKQYQLADWRIRPLPDEMLYYARSDTHYLLYIYDRVRNDLVNASDRSDPEKDLIGRALERSRELSLSRYEHPEYDRESGEGSRGWYGYVFKHPQLLYSSEQFAVFRAIWWWRDQQARVKDESPNYVLGTNQIADIARANPPDAKALHSLLPLTAPIARSGVNDLWANVQSEKARGGPSLWQFFSSMAPEGVQKNGLSEKPSTLPELEGVVPVSRLVKSQLFGDMPLSSRWDGSQKVSDQQGDYVPFPWQKFVDSATADSGLQYAQQSDIQMEEGPTVTPQPQGGKAAARQAEENGNEEFTLRRGTKRKQESSQDYEEEEMEEEEEVDEKSESDEEMAGATEGGVITIEEDKPKKKDRKKAKARRRQEEEDNEELFSRQSGVTSSAGAGAGAGAAKKTMKTEQKEKKKKVKEKAAGEKSAASKKYDAVPFDYSKAASVMHAERDVKNGAAEDDGRRPGKRVFDPYSKSGEDGPKAARKAPPVRGERSATFRR